MANKNGENENIYCFFEFLYPLGARRESVCYPHTYAENMEDANVFLLHQCLLVDHETQSGGWWSVCQCQRPDKDGPLYKYSADGVNPGFFILFFFFLFYLWMNLLGKKQFVIRSSAFQPHQDWCGWDWELHQAVFQDSVEPTLYMDWLDRGLLEGNSSLGRQFIQGSSYIQYIYHRTHCAYWWSSI